MIHPYPRRAAMLCAAIAATLFLLPDNAMASGFPAPATITWFDCPSEVVSREWTAAFAGRLQCGTMPAPLSYQEPDWVTVDIGLIRVRAADASKREGAIFFNFGGPGAHPADYLPQTAASWQLASEDSQTDGDKRRIADRYDLVAVVPRGLHGSPQLHCGEAPGMGNGPDPLIDLADWNWAGFVKDAREFALRCGNQPLVRFVDTVSHVEDMEYARLSMGEPRMNFFGVSYGTWVGSYYARTFPEHMGRFVMDSSMDITSTLEQIHATLPAAAQDRFERTIVRRVLDDPAYGVAGPDAAAVMARLDRVPAQARRAWMTQIVSPAHLAAVLTLGPWIEDERQNWVDAEHWDTVGATLRERGRRHRFSTDHFVDLEIRAATEDLIDMLHPEAVFEPDMAFGTYFAVACGDTRWNKTISDWRRTASETAARYPVKGGGGIMTGLICRHWNNGRFRPVAPMDRLAMAPPLLLVHAEHDTATPLPGAERTLAAMPSARMIVARGMEGHGVFGMSGTPCVEKAVGRYLLTGAVPAERSTSCAFEPSAAGRPVREVGPWPSVDSLRDELRRRFLRS